MIDLGNELETVGSAKRASGDWRSLLQRIANSRTNYWAAYLVDFSCPVLFGYLGLRSHLGWPSILVSSLSGAFLFTLAEYAIHRWLLHDPDCFLFPLHEAHHLRPEEHAAFLFPTSFLVLMPIWLLLTKALHLPGASFFLCGFSAAYFYYDTLHHFEHTVRINQIPFRWLQGRWAAHSAHHRLDNRNYGVMTSFWDYVFKTHQKQVKRKSRVA
jgi:sterol desaturase/sphingolipid hydroxylase (fatty acid hydroxylase superfamily)